MSSILVDWLPQLEVTWFCVLVFLFAGYAILDGFDLGVGMLHLFVKEDKERRLVLNSIGPVWDGNEVWLVTAGGALFAGFPDAYATLCSGFYEAIMLLLAGIIFRAVAIEFRSKRSTAWWRRGWDISFTMASFVITFALGVAMGNMIRGVSLGVDKEFSGSFLELLNPYALLVGLLGVALFLMHGAIYLLMKTEGTLRNKIVGWVNPAIIFFIMVYATVTMITLIYMPHMTELIKERPTFFVVGLINMLAIANIPREISLQREGRAFASSCVNIFCLMVLYGLGTFPNIVRASNDPVNLSLTIMNAASSVDTLAILILIALIGIPLVAAYTFCVYWVFHGKVRLDPHSY